MERNRSMHAERVAGARPQTTVMFADLSGFTALSERLDPEAATDLINRCFAVLDAVVEAHGGVVDRYIGDCIVAVWDLPDLGAAPIQAGLAACAIRAAVQAFNRTVAPPASLDVHVGIGTGPVIAGVMGGKRTGAFTVVGDTVALAHRLGDLSARGKIYTDAATHAAGAGPFAWQALEPVVLPPRPEPVAVYELGGLLDGEALDDVVQAALARGAQPLGADEFAARRSRRGSERRQATIVFAEVAGFERLAQTLAPEHFTGLVNHCFAALEPAVHGHGGVVDKYIGDTVMALFGVPNAIEEAPRQALNAVIEMRHLLQQFAEEQGLVGDLHLHAGVNSGLVIAGEMGGRTARAFTVIGDAVNVAARLKTAAADDAVYVGCETHRYTRAAFEFTDLPPLAVKGKRDPVPAWLLISDRERLHRGTASAAGGERAIASALVGRQSELAEIGKAVERVGRGQGGIVSVLGEAGLGKSRLIAELLATPLLEHVQVLEGRSLSIGQGLSFHPFVDLLRRWTGISDDDAPRDAGAKLARAVRELMPDEFDDVLPFIARLMGLRIGSGLAERVQGLDGEAMEELIFKSVRELLQHLARQRPLLLLFEDLHWADQSSIKLLESLLRLVGSEPLLIVAVGRPDFAATFERVLATARDQHASQLVELQLRPLTDQQCDALIQNLLRTDDLPYATRALIIRKAEGNPFFIEEVIRSFIDAGAVVYRGGRFHLTEKIDAVEVPGTIQEVILARVDRLDEFTRRVLQVASVIGRSFYHRILAAVMPQPSDIDAELAVLKDKQLVLERHSRGTSAVRRRTLRAELEYVFKHALAQEAIYGALLQRTRRELHRRVAESIERLFDDRLIDFYGMLAYHYSRGEELAKAEEYLFKAGEEAARSAASAEALNFFREASQLYFRLHGDGGDPKKKARLEKSIALALLQTGCLTESIEHFDNALRHLGRWVPRGALMRNVAFLRHLMLVLRQLYVWSGWRRRRVDWDTEREMWEVLFNRGRAEITSDPTRLFYDTVTGFTRLNQIDATQIDQASAIYASCAAVFCYSGISFAVSRKALAAATRLIRAGNIRDVFTCASMQWVLHYLEGDWSAQHEVAEEIVDEALRHGQLWDVNTYIGLYADMKLRQGDFATAGRLIEWLAEINDTYGFSFAGTNHDAEITLLLLEQRKLPVALRAAERYQSARHEDPLKVLGLGSKAKAQVLLGDLAGAEASLTAAERITSRSREVPPWHLSAYAAARLRYDIAALEQMGTAGASLRRRARRSARHAARIAGKAALQRTEIFQLCGHAHWLLGERRRAEQWWRRSLDTGARMGARPELARTQALIASCLDDAAAATPRSPLDPAACFEAARDTFAALGLEWDRARLEETAGRVRAA